MLNVFSRSSLRSVSRRCYHKISYDVSKSEIDLSGTIELTTKWDLTDAFEKVLINKPKMIKLIIDSPGGRTDVYKDILEQIKIMKKTRDFKLITVAKNDCSSAAIPILLLEIIEFRIQIVCSNFIMAKVPTERDKGFRRK